MIGALEKRSSRISVNSTKLGTLASCHPFTQQVDVIFPSECTELENALLKLGTRYARGSANLANVFSAGPDFVRPYTSEEGPESSILALSTNNGIQDDDVWCVDTRGVLTLCVCKETYEKLGLVGQKLPFKHQSDRYVISLPLHGNAESVTTQKRRRDALESWDARIATTGPSSVGPNSQNSSNGVWDVLYCFTADSDDNDNGALDHWAAQALVSNPVIHQVTCQATHLENVWIPNPSSIPPRPQPKEAEELEDWDQEINSLFEWVGMAGIKAQRLQANDRVDPYIALYDPPAPSRIGNVTHLRWRGLLSPAFVQSVVNASVAYLQLEVIPSDSFIAITAHGITNSPVVYLPRLQKSGPKSKSGSVASNYPQPAPPAHLPRRDAEDTWCLILTPPEEADKEVKSIMAENVGQWDSRWG